MAEQFDPKPQKIGCDSCGEMLFVSEIAGPGSSLRVMIEGTNDNLGEGKDERGPFIICRKCGQKHDVLDERVPGKGIQRKISGPRKEN